MKTIPEAFLTPCDTPGTVTSLAYGTKYALLYTPARPAERILYLIHGGGGDQRAFFCPAFLNMMDHMIAEGLMAPVYMVSPCFYDPEETDKRRRPPAGRWPNFPGSCGRRSFRWRKRQPGGALRGRNGRSAASPWAG